MYVTLRFNVETRAIDRKLSGRSLSDLRLQYVPELSDVEYAEPKVVRVKDPQNPYRLLIVSATNEVEGFRTLEAHTHHL